MSSKYSRTIFDFAVLGFTVYFNQALYLSLLIPGVSTLLFLYFRWPKEKRLILFNFLEGRLRPTVSILGIFVVLLSAVNTSLPISVYNFFNIHNLKVLQAMENLIPAFASLGAMLYFITTFFRISFWRDIK